MSNETILATGATGKTGSATIKAHLQKDCHVRAISRQQNDRSDRLSSLGSEVVFGNFHDPSTIRVALAGVNKAYCCYPPQGTHPVDATMIFAFAARDAGVETVVNMSQIRAREDASSPLSRQHCLSVQAIDRANIRAVHIASTFFVENLFLFSAQSMAEEGVLYLPYGDVQHAQVSANDLAAIITPILIEPERHRGKRHLITGPSLLSISEMAAVVSGILGKNIEYIDLPREAWLEALQSVPDMSQSFVTHFGHVAD